MRAHQIWKRFDFHLIQVGFVIVFGFTKPILFITIWIQATKCEFGWGVRQDFRCGMRSKH